MSAEALLQLVRRSSEGETQSGASTRSRSNTFDAMGNQTAGTQTSVSGGTVTTTSTASSFNGLNQLTSLTSSLLVNGNPVPQASTTFGYDGDGNLTGSSTYNPQANTTSGVTYTYDDQDRLTGIVNPGSSEVLFQYDGRSRLRVSQNYTWQNNAWVLTAEKHRLYLGMDVVQERDGNNLVTASVTRAGNIGGILARTDGSGSYTYHYDGQGNVTALTDSSGTTQARYRYDGFGNVLEASGTKAQWNPYGFSTKEQFGTLLNYGYRFYSPGLQRWLNRDPIRESGGVNLYGFVGNDAIQNVDVYGHDFLSALAGAGLGAVIGGAGAFLGGGDEDSIIAGVGSGSIVGAISGMIDIPPPALSGMGAALNQLIIEVLHHKCKSWSWADFRGEAERIILAGVGGAILGLLGPQGTALVEVIHRTIIQFVASLAQNFSNWWSDAQCPNGLPVWNAYPRAS